MEIIWNGISIFTDRTQLCTYVERLCFSTNKHSILHGRTESPQHYDIYMKHITSQHSTVEKDFVWKQ